MTTLGQHSIGELREAYRIDPRLWAKVRNGMAAIALAGWALTAAGYWLDRPRAEAAYLVAFVFFTTIAVGALFFTILQHLTGAAWSVTVRRLAENVSMTLPVLAILYVPLAFALRRLYPWARPEMVAADAILRGRHASMNPEFFLIRTAIYFAVWSLLAHRLYRKSVEQDRGGSVELVRSASRWSGAGIVLLTITVCLAAFDWLMSLDPHWYSTIFGIYVYAGAGLAGFAAITVIALALRRAGILRASVNQEHYHDLGKWVFALTVFWAYIAFSQYLLIWYANIPEETVWFRDRSVHGWQWLGTLLVFGHFLVPFFVLVSRAAKRNLVVLGAAALWMLLMQYVDLYWIAMPALGGGLRFEWIDFAAVLAVGGTVALAFWWRMRQHAIAPIGDLRFEKSLEFKNV